MAPPASPPAWPAARVEMVPLATLTVYGKNPRVHTPKQIEQIKASILEFGWTIPILRDEDGMTIAGHARLQAAKLLGLTEVPCMTAVGWTDDQKRAYVIADNKIGLNSAWDDDLLVMEMGDLATGEAGLLEVTGFDERELRGLLHFDPPTPAPDAPGAAPVEHQCPHCGGRFTE